MTSVSGLLEGKRVCVCGGSGGVGKTTTSAAIALGMAMRGARVAVVTIDPARRLANALGLEELENEPRRIDPAHLGPEVAGELWAMMLDPKRTFDELIARLAPDPQRAAAIMANRVYRQLSTAVSGSQEFTAVAKLHELAARADFDLLVLDTPPSRNALDFLEAPARLTSFLEGGALRALVRPTGLGMRLVGRGAAPLFAALRRVTGVDLVSDLGTFFSLLGGMTEDFAQRARAVQELLRAPTSAFVLVTCAQAAAIEEAIWFRRTLQESELPFAGVIVNRYHADGIAEVQPGSVRRALDGRLDSELARRVAASFADHHRLALRDRRNLEALTAELHGAPLHLVPQLDDDVHDLAGLERVRRHLFAAGDDVAGLRRAQREPRIAGA
ncbi:MAG: ArsA family ATPase [Solirubrobacterales bacterium]|nr:ArsA family ATPase [Solirubrobacterales bacterium]